MLSSLWATIHGLRAVSYFKLALDKGGTKPLKDKWDEDPSWRNKVMLSGVIAAATLAISGRTLYRSLKRHRKTNKRQFSTNDTKKRSIASQKFYDDQKDDEEMTKKIERPKASKKVGTDKKDLEQEYDAFYFDKLVTKKEREEVKNLLEMKVIDSDMSNSIKVKGQRLIVYLNGSGLFDKEHHILFDPNDLDNETFQIDKLIDNTTEHEITDILRLIDSTR